MKKTNPALARLEAAAIVLGAAMTQGETAADRLELLLKARDDLVRAAADYAAATPLKAADGAAPWTTSLPASDEVERSVEFISRYSPQPLTGKIEAIHAHLGRFHVRTWDGRVFTVTAGNPWRLL